jgi:response regulator RpfG family c-di-GMP phosphodiesterase
MVREQVLVGDDNPLNLKLPKVVVTVCPIVRRHHKGRTGNGHPDGLSGDDATLVREIMVIADSVVALGHQGAFAPATGAGPAADD